MENPYIRMTQEKMKHSRKRADEVKAGDVWSGPHSCFNVLHVAPATFGANLTTMHLETGSARCFMTVQSEKVLSVFSV